MTSDTQNAVTTGFPLVIPAITSQPQARLVLRNHLGQVVQQWLVKQNKCTLGSAPSCNLRCELPGIAPYHALLVIGARQTFVRALAPKLTRGGSPINELLLSDENSTFELAGHRFELSRHGAAKRSAPAENATERDARLRFTLARPFELQNRPKAASVPPTREPAPVQSSNVAPEALAPWMAKLIQSAIEPLESQLQDALKPIAELQAEARRQKQLRQARKAAQREQAAADQSAADPFAPTAESPIAGKSELQQQIEEVLARQSGAMDTLAERISDVSEQLATIERVVAEERTSTQQALQVSSSQLEEQSLVRVQQTAAIEQLQTGILAVTAALQSLQERQVTVQSESIQWKETVQSELGAIRESLQAANDRQADLQESPAIVEALARLQASQLQSHDEIKSWKLDVHQQMDRIRVALADAENPPLPAAVTEYLQDFDRRFDESVKGIAAWKTDVLQQLATLREELAKSQATELSASLQANAATVQREARFAQLPESESESTDSAAGWPQLIASTEDDNQPAVDNWNDPLVDTAPAAVFQDTYAYDPYTSDSFDSEFVYGTAEEDAASAPPVNPSTLEAAAYSTGELPQLDPEWLEQQLEQEQLDNARIEQAQLEQERIEQARLEQELLEQEQLELERIEQELLEREQIQQERLQQALREQERLEQERLEQEQLEQERREQERREQERLEQERLEREQLEHARLEKERLEQEQIEREQLEQARLEQSQLERARLEQVRLEQERALRQQFTSDLETLDDELIDAKSPSARNGSDEYVFDSFIDSEAASTVESADWFNSEWMPEDLFSETAEPPTLMASAPATDLRVEPSRNAEFASPELGEATFGFPAVEANQPPVASGTSDTDGFTAIPSYASNHETQQSELLGGFNPLLDGEQPNEAEQPVSGEALTANFGPNGLPAWWSDATETPEEPLVKQVFTPERNYQDTTDFSELQGLRTLEPTSPAEEPEFAETNFAETNFAETNFAETNFAETNFAETDYAETNFAETNFAETDFAETNFAETDFAGGSFGEPSEEAALAADEHVAEMELGSDLVVASGDDRSAAAEGEVEEDSVEDYMRKLLARMRGVPEEEVELPASAKKSSSPTIASTASGAVGSQSAAGNSAAGNSAAIAAPATSAWKPTRDRSGESESRSVEGTAATLGLTGDATLPFDPEKYVPRALAPEETKNLTAMRELANTTARTAIHKSTRQRYVTMVLLKMAIAGIGLIVASVLIAINGFNLNVGLIATFASLVVAAIWGYDAMIGLKPLLEASFVLNPDVGGNQQAREPDET